RELFTNLDEELKLTAIVPSFNQSTASLEERFAQVPRFADVDELMAKGEFDGAFVALSNNEGPEAAIKLAAAGKHVMVEKPLAGSAAAALPLVEAAANSGVAFQSGYMWRYDEAANRLRDMLADGRFGKLISLEMTFVTSDVKRRDPGHYLFDRETSKAGFFNWLACHQLDLLLYVTGQQVTGVTARTGVFGATDVEVEDGGVAMLDLSGGGIATFIGGYWLPRWAGEAHWTLRGSERWVHWDPARPGTGGVFEIHGPQPQWTAMEETFELPVDDTKGYGGIRALESVRDWLAAAKDGGRPCRNTPQSNVDTLQLIDTIYQSSAEGRRIDCSIG
ncbi:MAG: Gfo/Idh/MocA family protein, partial [Limisphaerales bacterium]